MRLGSHEAKLESRHQRARTLPCFLFEIRERMRRNDGPRERAFVADADNAEFDLIAVAGDRTLGDAARFVIRIQPASKKLFETRKHRLRQAGSEMAVLFEI